MTNWMDTTPTGFRSRVSLTNGFDRTIVVGYNTIIPPGETRPLPWFYDPQCCTIQYEFIDGNGEDQKR